MDARRSRRLLIAAFALSLLIHLIVASGVRWPFVRTRDETEIIHVQHLRVTRIAHVPTPPPHTPPPQTPAPSATPKPAPTAKPGAHRPPSTSGIAGATGKAGAAATPAPKPVTTPAPSATPACANNDLPAAIASSPPPPEISPQVRADGVSGTARIKVSLDANGTVQNAMVMNSTGSGSLDLVAVSMARSTQYTPAQHDCKAVASDYTFSVKFVSW